MATSGRWKGLAGPGALAAFLTLAGAGACSTSLESSGARDAGAPFAVTIPAGGRCAPQVASAALAQGESDGGCTSIDGGGDSSFGPARPLGVGYPDGANALPRHVAYLTFDDGPSEWTNDFLDILKSQGVSATFFVTAKQLKGAAGLDGTYVDEYGHEWTYRDLVRRELDEGHVVGNHTVDHPDLGSIGADRFGVSSTRTNTSSTWRSSGPAECRRCSTLFRPPFGAPWYTNRAAVANPETAQRAAGPRIAMHELNALDRRLDGHPGVGHRRIVLAHCGRRRAGAGRPPTPTRSPGSKTPCCEIRASFAATASSCSCTTPTTPPATLCPTSSRAWPRPGTASTPSRTTQRPGGAVRVDLTPGPSLYSACVDDRNWGCEAFGAPVGTDRAHEVCGRMWRAFEAFGGAKALGAPKTAPAQSATTGIVAQSFEKGVLELHPENPPPCNVVFLPQ